MSAAIAWKTQLDTETTEATDEGTEGNVQMFAQRHFPAGWLRFRGWSNLQPPLRVLRDSLHVSDAGSWRRQGEQGGAGGRFLGQFLRGTATGAQRLIEQKDGDLVAAGVVFTLGPDDFVAQGVVAVHGLDQLLQAPLGIFQGLDGGEPSLQRAVEVQDNAAGFPVVAVEQNCSHQGLEGILQGGGARTSSGGLLAGAELQGAIEADFARQLREEGAVGEGGAPSAERPLAGVGEKGEQRLGQHQLQHGVAEELEPLVAFREVGPVLQQGGMGEGALQERPVAEDVVEAHFERGGGGVHELALA